MNPQPASSAGVQTSHGLCGLIIFLVLAAGLFYLVGFRGVVTVGVGR